MPGCEQFIDSIWTLLTACHQLATTWLPKGHVIVEGILEQLKDIHKHTNPSEFLGKTSHQLLKDISCGKATESVLLGL